MRSGRAYTVAVVLVMGALLGIVSTPVLLNTPEPREDELPLAPSVVNFGAPRGH
jgi:hypothetical protein